MAYLQVLRLQGKTESEFGDGLVYTKHYLFIFLFWIRLNLV